MASDWPHVLGICNTRLREPLASCMRAARKAGTTLCDDWHPSSILSTPQAKDGNGRRPRNWKVRSDQDWSNGHGQVDLNEVIKTETLDPDPSGRASFKSVAVEAFEAKALFR